MLWIVVGAVAVLGAAVSWVDARTFRIPNRWMLVGTGFFLALQAVRGAMVWAMVGAVVGLAVTLLARWATRSLGLGDVKYSGVLGMALGPVGVLGTLGVASGLAVIDGLVRVILKRGTLRDPRPFGPFLAVASVVMSLAFLWGGRLSVGL